MIRTTFYARTLLHDDTTGKPTECHGYIYGSLQNALNEQPNEAVKLRRCEFVPLDAAARYRVALGAFCPPIDLAALIILRHLERRDQNTREGKRMLVGLDREYRRAMRSMPLPQSLVELSPQSFVQMDAAAEETFITRREGFARVARINAETVRVRGERSKGIYCNWATLIEVGQPLPFPRYTAIGIGSGCQIGSLECSTVRPVRIVYPTPDELSAYAIDWSVFAQM